MPAKILLVDDDADFAEVLSYEIKKKGYAIVTAANGREALEKLDSEKPDLVIFDIKMPEMDGYTFYRTLRRQPEYKTLPAIALTSFDAMKDIFAVEGLKDYFVKSEKTEVLLDTISKRLSEVRA